MISKHVFYCNFMRFFLRKHLFMCLVNILYVLGEYTLFHWEILYLAIWQPYITNDLPRLLFHLNFYWLFIWRRYFRTTLVVQSSYGSTSRKLQHKLWLRIWKAEYMLFQIKKCLPKSTPWKVVIFGVKVAILMKNR